MLGDFCLMRGVKRQGEGNVWRDLDGVSRGRDGVAIIVTVSNMIPLGF